MAGSYFARINANPLTDLINILLENSRKSILVKQPFIIGSLDIF
jgi:hypothetical protein